MNIITRWEEYDNGKLTPPCIVQYDIIRDEHLVWVWTGDCIKQMSRSIFDEASILDDAVRIIEEPVIKDEKDTKIEELQVQVETLQSEKAILISEKKTLISEKEITEIKVR